METYNLSAKRAIQLLNEGNSLTQSGKDLNTITKNIDGTFTWKGRYDRGATILEEKSLDNKFFAGKEWAINLL